MPLGRVIRLAAIALFASTATPAFAETLKEALASAYVNNPQLASALLSVHASAEDIALRKAGKLPTISATADMSATYALSNGIQSNTRASSVGLTYSQTLFDNLKTDAQIEQARALSVVASETLRNSEQNVLLQTASAYVAVIRDTRLVQLRAANVKFFQQQVESAKSRKEIGEGTDVSVAQARASLAQAVASYKSAIASLKTSQATYQRWVGHKPRNLSLSYNFGGVLPKSLDQALDQSMRLHPAILSAKAQLRAAQSASDAAKAAFGPTLSLIGNIGGSFSSNSLTGNANSGTGTIKLSLSVPLYAGGAMGASVRKANINQIKGEMDALDARDQVRETVISSWAGLQNAAAQITSAKSAVSASQLSLDGIIEQQRVGQLTTLDVLNARTSLTGVQEAQISAETSKIVAAFSLVAAAGKLSARDLNLPVSLKSGDGYIQKVEDVWQELRAVSN